MVFENNEQFRRLEQEFTDELSKAFARAGELNIATEKAIEKIVTVGLVPHLVDAVLLNFSPIQAIELMDALLTFERSTIETDFHLNFLAVVALQARKLMPTIAQQDAKRIEQRFRNTEIQIAKIISNFKSNGGSDLASNLIERVGEYEFFMRKVADDTRISLDDVDIHGASGEISRASLEKIFVDCPVHPLARSEISTFRERLETDDYYPRSHRVGWKGILELGPRIVLLGDPGGGKSSHSNKICCEIAALTVDYFVVMPLFIHLRALAAARQKNEISLFEYVVDHVSMMCPDIDREDIKKNILYNLGVGRALVVFDGLDEVLSDAARINISKEITHLSKQFLLSRFIVTSRFVGYELAPLETFQHVAIGKLDEPAMRLLYKNVCVHNLGMENRSVENRIEKFFRVAKEKARELISNPLLLTLIIIVESKKREIPDNRADLYAICAELLFDRWDRFRDIVPDLPERYRLYDLLMFISSQLYENEDYGGRVSKDKLLRMTREFFKKDYIDNKEGRASEAAAKFVDHLTGRAWILHEVGENIFEFTHRTFMEYFYARHLDAQNEITEDLFNAVKSSLFSGQRTVPAHLAFQIRAKDNRKVSSKIATCLVEALNEQGSFHLLQFSSQTCSYLLPTAEELDILVGKVTQICAEAGISAPLLVLFNNDGPLQSSIKDRLVASLEHVPTVPTLAGLAPLFDRVARWLDIPDLYEKEKIQSHLQKAIYAKFKSLERKSPFVAKLLFDLQCPVDGDALSRHGLRLWVNNHSQSAPDTRYMDGLHMLAALTGGLYRGAPVEQRYGLLAKAVSHKQAIDLPQSFLDVAPYRSPFQGDFAFQISLENVNDEHISSVVFLYMFIVESLPPGHFGNAYLVGCKSHQLMAALRQRESLRYMAETFDRWLREEFSLFRLRYYYRSRSLIVGEFDKEGG